MQQEMKEIQLLSIGKTDIEETWKSIMPQPSQYVQHAMAPVQQFQKQAAVQIMIPMMQTAT